MMNTNIAKLSGRITGMSGRTADKDYHIKRQIGNLARRAESTHAKPRNSFRKSRQATKNVAAQTYQTECFWKQFRRSSISQSQTKIKRQESGIKRPSSQSIKRCKSAFYRQMFQEEERVNGNQSAHSIIQQKLDIKSDFLESPIIPAEMNPDRKGKKQLVERYIFKQRPSLSGSLSNQADDYLQSKRKIPHKKSILTQPQLTIIKM